MKKQNPSSEKYILSLIILFAIVLRMLWINSLVERDEGQFAYNALVNYVPNNPIYKMHFFDDNKTPFLYLFYSIPILFFKNSIYAIRFFNNLFFWVSVLAFFKISGVLFKKKAEAYLSTIIFVLLMNIPYFEGQLAMSESIGLHFTIFGFYFLIKYAKEKKKTMLVLSILLFLIAFLIRMTLAVNFIILMGFHYFLNKNNYSRKKRYFLLYALAPFVILLAIFFMIKLNNIMGGNYLLEMYHLSNFNYVPLTNWVILILESLSFILLSFIGVHTIFSKGVIKYYNLFIFAFLLTLTLGFLPNAYGHYFISVLPYLAIACTAGIIAILPTKTQMIKILFSCFILFSFFMNICFWIYQYPDFNWNRFGFKWMYSDSDSRDIQEEISQQVQSLIAENESVFLMGWEPYICFRAIRSGCSAYFSFENLGRYEYTQKQYANASIYVFYNIFNYSNYNINLSDFSNNNFTYKRGAGYYLYVRNS